MRVVEGPSAPRGGGGKGPHRKAFVAGGLLLIGVVMAAGSAVACFVYDLRSYGDRLEALRIPLLRRIAAAQAAFKAQDLDGDGVHDFGSLDELVEAGLLDRSEVSKTGAVDAQPAKRDPCKRW